MRGHIRERSPGCWAIIVDGRDSSGKRKRVWHSFRGTRRQVEIERARLVTEAQGGGAVDPSHETVAGYLDRFERDWVAVNVSARTAERYRQLLDHVRRHLGGRRLQKLRLDEVAGLYATLLRSGLAARTIRHLHGVTFQALGQAKAWNLIRARLQQAVGAMSCWRCVGATLTLMLPPTRRTGA